MDKKSLYSLPKDILVELISTIQEKTIKDVVEGKHLENVNYWQATKLGALLINKVKYMETQFGMFKKINGYQFELKIYNFSVSLVGGIGGKSYIFNSGVTDSIKFYKVIEHKYITIFPEEIDEKCPEIKSYWEQAKVNLDKAYDIFINDN